MAVDAAGEEFPERINYAHERTGEVREYAPVKPRRKRGEKPVQKTGGRWTKLYDDHLFRLMGLTGTELHVFLTLVGETNVDHSFMFSTTDIADMLNIAPTQVSRALRVLRAHGLVIRVDSSRRWYLDPRVVWRGSDPSRETTITELSSVLDEPSRKDNPA